MSNFWWMGKIGKQEWKMLIWKVEVIKVKYWELQNDENWMEEIDSKNFLKEKIPIVLKIFL